MKIFNKLVLVVGVAGFALASCENEYPEYSAGAQANPNSSNAYFDPANATSIAITLDDNAFNVIVKRENAEKATTVNLAEGDPSDMFTIPSNVAFAEGEDSVTIAVACSDKMESFKSYQLSITIDESETNPYVNRQDSFPTIVMNVVREDYASLGQGQFYDSFTLYSVADVKVEYSTIKDAYRISCPYSEEKLLEAEWTGWLNYQPSPSITFYVSEMDTTTNLKHITWDNYWYIGLNYQGTVGAPIKAYLPSSLDASLAASNLESYVHPEFDEKLWVITPYYYIDGLGGFGLKPCYLSLPGGPNLYEVLSGE